MIDEEEMNRCLSKPRIALFEKNLIWTPLVSTEPPYYEPEEVYNLLFEFDSANDHSNSNNGIYSMQLNDKLKKKRKRRRWNKAYDHQNTRRKKKPASKALEMMENRGIESTSQLKMDIVKVKKIKKKRKIKRKPKPEKTVGPDGEDFKDDDDDFVVEDDDSFVVDDEEEENDGHSNHDEEEKKITRPGILNVIRSFFGRRDTSSSTSSNDRTLITTTTNNNCDNNNVTANNGNNHQGTSNGTSTGKQHRRQASNEMNGNASTTSKLSTITPLKITVKRIGQNGQLIDSSQPVFSIENKFSHSTPVSNGNSSKLSPPVLAPALATLMNGIKRVRSSSSGSMSPQSSSSKSDGNIINGGGGRKSPIKLNGGGGDHFEHCRTPSPSKMSNGKL